MHSPATTHSHATPLAQQPPLQQPLPLDLPTPPNDPDAAPPHVLAEARRMWQASVFWHARFKSLEALLADPARRRMFLTCARAAWLTRMRAKRR